MGAFTTMGVREIQSGLAARDFTANEIVDDAFERIYDYDGRVHAFLETTEGMAREAADRIAFDHYARAVRWA